MLRLDSLQLIGFKSFAEKTHIRFGDGIACMIGPNGCGKSNLADAIGWVLGVQSAYSLRGERMEDVIFSGTRKRRPSGFVETTLVFSRTDDKPIVLKQPDFSGERLQIGRKLYRSGESVYSINQRRCRLKDVHAVLEEAELGFASYALIAQGKIEWFLSARALERRTVIEEAARITGYKSRRRSAELKLELAQQNLVRVNDIIAEIERQLRSLKRQAAKARRYREVKEKFRQVQRQRLMLQAQELKVQLEVLLRELEQHKTLQEELKKELVQREQAHRKTLEKRERLETHLSELRQSLSEIRLEVDRTENSIQYHQEQIEATRKSLTANAAEQQTIEQSLEKVEGELDRFQSECSALDEEGKRVEANVRKQAELVDRYKTETEEAENRLEEVRSRLVRLSAHTVSLNNLKEQLEQRLKAAQFTHERLEKERSQHSLQLKESTARLKDTTRRLEKKKSQVAQLRQRLRKQEGKKKDLERQLEELEGYAVEINNQLIAQRERLQSLQEIELNHSQYSEGVQKFLKHLYASQTVKAGGTLADFVQTSPQYERLVEEFLDKELEYILVDSLEQAVQGLSELRTLKSGKCTFLALSSSNGFDKDSGQKPAVDLSTEEGVYGTLSDLVQMKPEVKSAFHRALPQRAQAIVVSDLGRAFGLAQRYPENTFITLQGESLTPRGLLSAGAVRANRLGLLSLKRKKTELEKQILQLQKKLAGLRHEQDERQEQLRAASKLFFENEESLLQLEKEIIGLTHEQGQWESEERREKQALKVVDGELTQLDLERKQQRRKVSEVEEQLNEEKASQATVERMLSQSQKFLQQLKVEFGRTLEQLHLVSSDRKVLDERRLALKRTLERIEEQRNGLEARKELTRAAAAQSEKRLESMRMALQSLRSDFGKYREKEKKLASTLQEKEQEYMTWKENYPETEKLLVDLRDRKTDLQEKRAQLDIERARLETQLQNISQQCLEQLQMSLDEAAVGGEPQEMSLEGVLERYEELKDRLEKFGPINMAALQEYQESEERCDFLRSQRQDIEESIADTTHAIQEINRKSRQRFRKAFDVINLHLNAIFQKLFGGGECGMRLLDEEDLLESGIDIYAQPPGKKLQNVMLLSGGEKVLTVFALLMALFAYRPSRFCVLDEVDAALDDSNITRFTQLIRQMSQQTQFIIITHNKRTMETADAIFGVTMEEPGISQIVSVRLDLKEPGARSQEPGVRSQEKS
ncbi:MAG: chromosome segregation protein SMC [Acidobacteriota bacterium]